MDNQDVAKNEMLTELRLIREARERGEKVDHRIGTLEQKIDTLAKELPLDPVKLAADEKFGTILDGLVQKQIKAAYDADKERGRINGQLVDSTGFTFEQRQLLQTRELERYYDPATVGRIRTLQELQDEALLVGFILHESAKRAQLTNDPLPTNFIRQTRAYKQLMKYRAMDTLTASEGLEWVPVEFSGQLFDVVTVSLKVAALFASITMPTPIFKLPVATTDDIAFLVPENITDAFLNDANKMPAITPGTGNVTLTARKLGALTVFSEEINEDSIIAIVPFLRMKLGNAIANAIERAIIDGDTAGTHMDNDVSVASDARKAWNGLRKDAITSATNYDVQSTSGGGEATLTVQDLLRLRGLLDEAYGENPDDLVYVMSTATAIKILPLPELITVDKLGPNATIIRGQIGMLWGTPVITSKYSRMNLASTGVNTGAGPNNTGAIVLVNRNGWILGNRRGVTIKSAEAIWSDQALMAVTWRGDFQKLRVGKKVTSVGINVPL
jgi:HK97 family phage major capsid protein